jgi:hypothetical protein
LIIVMLSWSQHLSRFGAMLLGRSGRDASTPF